MTTEEARELGRKAFENGKIAVPALDVRLMKAVTDLSSSDWKNHGQIMKLMKAWSNGWHTANVENRA